MRWYQGGIAEAVTVSKKNGSIFVVFVEGKDNKSQELTKLINNEEVAKELSSQHFVAIKVEENSIPHQQFSQIYKQATVPSLFFIGKNGTPLEIITEPLGTQECLNKLERILEKNGIKTTPSAQTAGEQSEAFIKSELTDQSNSVVCENGVCAIKPSTSKEPENNPALSSEEKVERAKELLNQKREAKRAEEDENARIKEMERRKVGQDVQKLKRWQQENELKDLMEERNKEKKEAQEARQRVLAQIAQDKAERAAKFAPQQSPPAGPQGVSRSPAAVNSNSSRLQFKLPDGSSHTHEFPSDTSLQNVRNYIITEMNLPFSNFTLSTTFPRREFTREDGSQSLLELGLVPNAVVLILPLHHGTVSTNSDSWMMTMFWSFITPILNLLNYLKGKIFGSPGTGAPPPATANTTSQEKKRPNENTGETSNVTKKRMGETSVVRRHGNIHRLADKTDSDDDNNTWNGNSTQQM